MKRKLISFFSIIAITLSCSNTPVYAQDNTLYRAYTLDSDEGYHDIIKIMDGENDKISYCYDFHKSPPENLTSRYKTYYKKQNDFLNSDDEDMNKYGKEKKKRIASVLAAAYPMDMYGLFEKSGLTETEAINVVQYLIWDINEDRAKPLDPDNGFFTENEVNYYNEIYNYSLEEFKQGNLKFKGDFKFYDKNGYYATENIDTTGYKGDFTFENLPSSMKVVDSKTNEVLDNNTVNVGDEFYIVSEDKPNDDLKLDTKYSYREVLFYFYKFSSGGRPSLRDKYQSLVQPNLGDNATMDLSLDIDVAENDTPTLPGGDTDIGNPDENPNLPGDTDTSKPDENPSLPGDNDTNKPNENPSLPGDNDTSKPNENPNLPGDTDISKPNENPSLPGDNDTSKPDDIPSLYPDTGENADLYGYIALGLISLLILKFSLFKKTY